MLLETLILCCFHCHHYRNRHKDWTLQPRWMRPRHSHQHCLQEIRQSLQKYRSLLNLQLPV